MDCAATAKVFKGRLKSSSPHVASFIMLSTVFSRMLSTKQCSSGRLQQEGREGIGGQTRPYQTCFMHP